ncbi:MAG: V-type ATP synthase subunit D [Sphaerochaetaceae bacterium]|jgi:V/A-type H+-transporting ATPase subunit D|nr:V-type ATP synthase subunit D [Sphaerochaetaceae bacterium]MDD3366114.1 V-type ATP synthase subunit D [Sphaerochaetaceae bacterium]MDD4219480.1 V-type ATP synthase subunit D [Sphaerochaetaceae bacterium]MDY0371621.1 V-type ATP synthase subunit D [Sphaerochaetaceae bacterium]
MAAVKLTKNEQKKQKDQLKQFERYLPTLQLKKQQLQMVIRQIEQEVQELRALQKQLVLDLQDWVAVFHENNVFAEELQLDKLVVVDKVVRSRGNIAGVAIPIFQELEFKDIVHDITLYPLWVDTGLISLREIARYDAMIATLEKQIELLGRELRTTSQRVNLFEKVKIPETKENIRKIGIYLGDQQTAAVVRGKIAKKKLVKVSEGVVA